QTRNHAAQASHVPFAARQTGTAGPEPLPESEKRRDRVHSGLRCGSREGARLSRRASVGTNLFRARRREGIMNCEEARTQFVDYWRGTLEDPLGDFRAHLDSCERCQAEAHEL